MTQVQRRRDLVILYGLPGSGKTSLGRRFAELAPDYFFADIASHPRFGEVRMADCVIDLYRSGGVGRNVVTEGVLATPEIRDRFAHRLRGTISPRKDLAFRQPKLVFLDETCERMAERRREQRTLDDYRTMRQAFPIGSDQFPHLILDGANIPDLDQRVAFLQATLPQAV